MSTVSKIVPKTMKLGISLMLLCVLGAVVAVSAAAQRAPVLALSHSISDEPLLGGMVVFDIELTNTGSNSVTDKGYNLTITDTLPVGLDFVSADPAVTFIESNDDGTTTLFWDNISDIEVNEEISISVTASVAGHLSASSNFLNRVYTEVNTAPDNSGSWITLTDELTGSPQAIDIELDANQSTADEQATGAGEYDGSARWPYSYTATVRNNNVGDTENVVAKITLPSGIAYMGNPAISPNPNGAGVTPALSLQADGSLEMTWSLGTLTTAEYTTPIEITFDTAIPYEHRTSADLSAEAGPFAGPMSGALIAEDTSLPVAYEATAEYLNVVTSDGTDSTPDDDAPEVVIAEYLALAKYASPNTVGVGTNVTFTINWYVSEYYTTTNVVIQDILPDGMTYVADSASVTPASVQEDTPGAGQTTITWNIDPNGTKAGDAGTLTLNATVDSTWEAAPYTNDQIVSGDTLVNLAISNGDWADQLSARSGTLIEDQSRARLSTRMPTFTKEVWDPVNGEWSDLMNAYAGDTARFRLRFDAAADINASDIVIRDFLPRGMTWNNVANHTISGSADFMDDADCTAAPTTPTVDTLSGLQFLEWKLCDVMQNGSWEVEIEALIGDEPNIQPGWIVANFGKLSGQNTFGDAYSMRAMANVAYRAPELTLTKASSPWKNLDASDTINYSIVVENTGQATAYNLVLTDTLPADLIFARTGGSASPAASSYTTVSGDPDLGTGGTIAWSSIASLGVGESITFSYAATVPTGVFAGQNMTNIASVGYNSRSDNTGHQTSRTADVNDTNTDDHTVFVNGATIEKAPDVDFATIGDRVNWTLTVTVPAGVVAYWPIVEENNLPDGFDYVTGSSAVNGATLDTTNHAENPRDSGFRDLRWFVETIDNTSASDPYVFTITFETLVTGVKGTDTSTTYYDINCCYQNADNDAFVGWYSDATGYNNTGFAYTAFGGKNHVDARSPQADGDVTIRQPNMLLSKSADRSEVGAGELVTFTLQSTNLGNDTAWETVLSDTLPVGLTFVETVSWMVTPADANPLPPSFLTDNNTAGDTVLEFELDRLHVGSIWTLIYTARVDANISASLSMENTVQMTQYTSKQGVISDTNGDGLPDERYYVGPSDSAVVQTPDGSVSKAMTVADAEFTVGSTVLFTITVPAIPTNAELYNVVVTDTVDAGLTVLNVSNGSHVGNAVSATFGSIPAMTQEQIVVTAAVQAGTSADSGDTISNQATMSYTNAPQVYSSNVVEDVFIAPALVVGKMANVPFIQQGDRITYTIVVNNVGDALATNFTLTDTPPAEISLVAGSATLNGAPLADPVGGVWSLPSMTLNGGEAFTITVGADVTGAVSDDVPYVNAVAVTALDSEGAQIPADNSAIVSADTDLDDTGNAPVYSAVSWEIQDDTFVAYEDLRNINYVDWDYNDFIVEIGAEFGVLPSGNIGAIRMTYDALARGAFLNHKFIHEVPVMGGGSAFVTVRDPNGDVVSQHAYAIDDNPELTIFANTIEALPVPSGALFTNTEREQTALQEGHTAEMIIVLADDSDNFALSFPRLPWDPYIFVYDTNQEVHLPIPGHSDNLQTVNGLFDSNNPLIGHSLPLARVLNIDWDWPIEAVGMWRSHPTYDEHVDSGEVNFTEWYKPSNAADEWTWDCYRSGTCTGRQTVHAQPYLSGPESRYYASPVVSDLDGNGSVEIVMADMLSNRIELFNALGQPLWSAEKGRTDGNIKATPVLADIAGDSANEIIVGDSTGKLYAFDSNGDAIAGWPIQLAGARILATPVVTDLDGSGLSILVPLANGRLYAVNTDGSAKWNVSIGDVLDKFDSQVINSSPVVADLTGDGSLEIIVGSHDKNVYIFNADGSVQATFATDDVVYSSPTVVDIDGDASTLEILIGSGDSYLYALDSSGQMLWKQRTGWIIKSTPVAADMDDDGDVEILIGNDDGLLWAYEADGTRVAGWPKATESRIEGRPVVGDIDGDGKMDVVVASADASVYAWHGDTGQVVSGWPQRANVSIFATPALVNIDSDPALEVIVGDFDGNLYIWGGTYHILIPIVTLGE